MIVHLTRYGNERFLEPGNWITIRYRVLAWREARYTSASPGLHDDLRAAAFFVLLNVCVYTVKN